MGILNNWGSVGFLQASGLSASYQESMSRKWVTLAVLVFGTVLQTSPAPLRALSLTSSGLSVASLPSRTAPVISPAVADFNHDGLPENLVLAGGRLTIFSAGQPDWQSPNDWTVLQAGITDLNQDGTPEATLLVWRPFRPWPVDQWLPQGGRIANFHDAAGNSCQIILIGWRGSQFGELWAGSALAEPVRSFVVADLNGDTKQELVTLEGNYADSRSGPARALKVWEWNGFGFTVVSTIDGAFYKMALARATDGRILILVP
jgi:hypothetical protein